MVTLAPSGNGWAEWRGESAAAVHVRFALGASGRLEPVELHLRLEEGLTSETMRSVPVSRMAAAANSPALRDALIAELDSTGDGEGFHVLGDRPDELSVQAWRRLSDDLAQRLPYLDQDSDEPAYELPTRRAPNLKLPVEDSRARSDHFYELVADRYTWLVMRTRKPAADLAEANGVPITTAHRWIKEARRRGFLAPGRRGAAG